MREYVLVLFVAAAVTYLLTPLVRRGAIATGAVKVPRSRDVHDRPTPTLGGIAMYCGLAAGLLVAERLSYLHQAFVDSAGRQVPGLLLAGGLLVLVGVVDDRWGLGVVTKLAGQVAAGVVLVWSGVSVDWVPEPSAGFVVFDTLQSTALTVAIVVITVNAVNFIDGLDGLAAGVVAVAALSYLVYSYTQFGTLELFRVSPSLPAVSSAVLAGMCLGFLPHNFHPARIFMGDTGAMLLGLLLAYGPISSLALSPQALVNYQQHPLNRFSTILPLLVPTVILIIPYTDLVLAVMRRFWRGRSPFAADAQHLHHRLLNIGHSQRQSVLIMYLWAVLFAGTVVALSLIRTGLIWLAVVTVVAALVLLPGTIPRLRPWGARKHPARSGRDTSAPAGASAARAAAAAGQAAPSPSIAAVPPFAANDGRATSLSGQ